MDLNSLIQRVDQLLDLGRKVLATRQRDEDDEWIDSSKLKGFRSAVLSFIEMVYGPKHTHYTEFDNSVKGDSPSAAKAGNAILEAIRDEIAGGWLFSVKGLVTAEIFADFLEMAEYLLSQDYKDPAT
ncbi:unnamed protein product, partial [marine sediment metagenome]